MTDAQTVESLLDYVYATCYLLKMPWMRVRWCRENGRRMRFVVRKQLKEG